jgi:hypothetical protein
MPFIKDDMRPSLGLRERRDASLFKRRKGKKKDEL